MEDKVKEKLYERINACDENLDMLDNIEEMTRKHITDWNTSGALWRQLEWCAVNKVKSERLGEKLVAQLNEEFFNQFMNYDKD